MWNCAINNVYSCIFPIQLYHWNRIFADILVSKNLLNNSKQTITTCWTIISPWNHWHLHCSTISFLSLILASLVTKSHLRLVFPMLLWGELMFSICPNKFMMCQRVAKVIGSFCSLPDPIPPFRHPCYSVIQALAIWSCDVQGPGVYS